ncbi:MAG: chemotaxis protein CheW [Candidatus Thiodiazotropha sp. (ex Myrtea spinifera)]|nr:chemotaxis protein CheW [Candidatus Thiodiazotropha sp. (ex Myrtea spinifera)]MCU7827960.1 chemotaxis protein CheW [Candidatus Thiodiazotropha sp. (ex Myrtea sp. 'scaly one' KF741663)]
MNSAVVSEVRSVLIPLADRQLLLPNAVVAEVMGYQPPEPVEEGSEWYLGNMAWRGVLIPVISFEAMLGGEGVAPGHRGRIAIMNALNGNPRLSHFGMVVQAIPSLVRVSIDNVMPKPEASAEEDPLIRQAVELDLSPAYIPSLDEIERRLSEVI